MSWLALLAHETGEFHDHGLVGTVAAVVTVFAVGTVIRRGRGR